MNWNPRECVQGVARQMERVNNDRIRISFGKLGWNKSNVYVFNVFNTLIQPSSDDTLSKLKKAINWVCCIRPLNCSQCSQCSQCQILIIVQLDLLFALYINPFATSDVYMQQLFHCLQWYAGSERVKQIITGIYLFYFENSLLNLIIKLKFLLTLVLFSA